MEVYFYLDGSLSSGNPYTVFPDASNLAFGTGGDLRIYHDGTNSWLNNATGDLKIRNAANDKDIIFQCDDGSGGEETYFYLEELKDKFEEKSLIPIKKSPSLALYKALKINMYTLYCILTWKSCKIVTILKVTLIIL